MADKKISELNSLTGANAADGDLVAIVHVSATETKKITRSEFFTNTPSIDVNADSIRVRTAQTPATASEAGDQGEIAWDADYIYICIATDTWKRVAIATW
jgi:hypothetical protein